MYSASRSYGTYPKNLPVSSTFFWDKSLQCC